MKSKYIFTLLSAALLQLSVSSCTDEPDQIIDMDAVEESNGLKTMEIAFDAPMPSYDTQSRSDDWTEGSTIYLTFQSGTSNPTASGSAKYTDNKWVLSYTGTIPTESSATVDILYYENEKASIENLKDGVITFNNTQPIYFCSTNYEYKNEKLEIIGTLTPCVSRIRFKSEETTSIDVKGLKIFSSYNPSTGKFQYADMDILNMKTNDGVTPYIYFHAGTETSDLILKVDEKPDSYVYAYRDFVKNADIKPGESGSVTIPTQASHEGWEYSLYTTISGYTGYYGAGSSNGTQTIMNFESITGGKLTIKYRLSDYYYSSGYSKLLIEANGSTSEQRLWSYPVNGTSTSTIYTKTIDFYTPGASAYLFSIKYYSAKLYISEFSITNF